LKILSCLRFTFSLIVFVFTVCVIALIAAFPTQALEPSLDHYRTNTPETIASSVPASLMKTVTADPERKIPDLVAFLSKGSDDPFLTVKRIHDWIALNIIYDTSVPIGGTPPPQHWATILSERRGVCAGYSNLFAKMAELAGFECSTIGGYARGIDYDLFSEGEEMKDNHAWNKVKIGEDWYLIDCTWDAGSATRSGYTQEYSTVFLFFEPEKMIFSHFPAKEEDQLLPKPFTKIEFLKCPVLKGEFFGYGLSLDPGMDRISTAEDRFEFTLHAPSGVALTPVLYQRSGMEMKNRTFVTPTAKGSKVSVLFPRQGEWVVKLYARRLADAKKEYTWCGDLGFLPSKGTEEHFPSCYGAYNDRGCVLHSPLTAPLRIGSTVTLKIKAPGAKNAAVNLRGKLILLDRSSEKDTFEKKIQVPFGRELIITAQYEENASFTGLVRYDVGK
jgi:hypothetical protein